MKTIYLLILILMSIQAKAQNTVYLIAQPIDRGIGLRIDHRFIYGTISKGSYVIEDNYIKNHIRTSAGLSLKVQGENQGTITIGAVLHKYGDTNYEHTNILYSRIFSPFSYEIGAGVKSGRLACAFRMDVLKWEGCVDIGYNLWKNKK